MKIPWKSYEIPFRSLLPMKSPCLLLEISKQNATQKIATKEQLSADPLQDVQPGAEILVEKNRGSDAFVLGITMYYPLVN